MENRISGFKLKRAGKNCRHLVISPPSDVITEDMPLSKVYDICVKHLKIYFPDVYGGEIIFHPFRLKSDVLTRLKDYCITQQVAQPSYSSGGFWNLARSDVLNLGHLDDYRKFSPHFHVICFGRFPYSDEYHKSTNGWVYKNVRDISLKITINEDGTHKNEVEATVSYLLTYCGIELNELGKAVKSRHSFGFMTSRYFRLDKETKEKPEYYESYRLCPECKEQLIITDENGVPKLHVNYGEDMVDDWIYIRVVTSIPVYELHNPIPRQKRNITKDQDMFMIDNRAEAC